MMFRSVTIKHILPITGVSLAIAFTLLSASSIAAQEPTVIDPRYDLTGNRIVNQSDARDVGEAWLGLREAGQCLSPFFAGHDIDRNGCVEIADVQMVAAEWGNVTDANALAGAASLSALQVETTFVVNDSSTATDANPGDGACRTAAGTCTLRAAVNEANIRRGRENIHFNILNPDGSCPDLVTIASASTEPSYEIDDPYNDGVVINGYTQCGASANTSTTPRGNATIKIELKGALVPGQDGIEIDTANNVIRGLAIYNWDFQIRLDYSGATKNRIEGNFIGTNAAQTFRLTGSTPEFGEQHHEGVRINGEHDTGRLGGASENVIGGNTPAARNIISGNRKDGIKIRGQAHDNRIIGNYIGIKQDGETPLANWTDGADFVEQAYCNWLGGEGPGERNVITGNFSEGIEISHNRNTKLNRVVGNYFGLTAYGTKSPYGNSGSGFSFEDEVSYNYAYNNVVAGNKVSGVFFFILGSYNEVYNNKIGVGPDGVTSIPNGWTANPDNYYGRNGIQLMGGAHHNRIYNNIIANHPEAAVELKNTSDDKHNYFGETFYNTLSRNIMYNNGSAEERPEVYGIDLKVFYKGGAATYPNQGLRTPTISSATAGRITGNAKLRSGAACVGCTIEVFIADTSNTTVYGEGKEFRLAGLTDGSGNFSIPVCNGEITASQVITATSTDTAGNTSEFSLNRSVSSGTRPQECSSPTTAPSPTPTPRPLPPQLWLPLVRK